MISKRIATRKDGGSSARKSLRYGEGLKQDRETGLLMGKSLRTYFSGFGVVDDGVYASNSIEDVAAIIELAAKEMQANCDANTRVGQDKKIAHFVVSFDQHQPTEAVLRDTETSMLSALKLHDNHWASFLHNDNGHWHLHVYASRIDKIRHNGNDLWRDKIIRDRVTKEIERRHGLKVDNGLHKFDENGQLVMLSEEERASRKGKPSISDKAAAAELHADAQSFQSWALEIRIGDRLKHAKSWKELHETAAAYGCEIKPKGAGFIISPIAEKGGIQLSKVGLKNLTAKYGEFQPALSGSIQNVEVQYSAIPKQQTAQSHYQQWRTAKQAFQPIKAEQVRQLREAHKAIRASLKESQKLELNQIRVSAQGANRQVAMSVAKMNHAIQLQALSDQLKRERGALYQSLAEIGPGNTFHAFLMREASKGDNQALGLLRKYGSDSATNLTRHQESIKLAMKAAIAGKEYRPALRLPHSHRIEANGSVVYDLGSGRQITDSAITKLVRLNPAAAQDQEAIATSLRFALLKFGPVLTLTGSPDFQKLAVETAAKERLNVRFGDPALEAYRQQLLTKSFTSPAHHKENQHAPAYRQQQINPKPPAHRNRSLHDMSLGDVVLDTDRDVRILRTHVSDRVEQLEEREDRTVQRPTGRAERAGSPENIESGLNAGAGTRTAGRQISVSQSAHDWAMDWSETSQKKIVPAKDDGTGKVAYTVIHVAVDGVVLDLGRTIAVYPPSRAQLNIGSKVTINQGQIFLQQKSPELENKRAR